MTTISRGWETVALGTPSGNSQLLALRKNNSSDNLNIRFSISDIISNPSNTLYWAPDSFTQNGLSTNGSPIITGLGSTSRMYVGMAVTAGVFPDTVIVSIDSATQITVGQNASHTGSATLNFTTNREGSDTDGTGQITKPFSTYEKARQRAVDLGAGQGNPWNLVYLGSDVDLGAFVLSPYVNIDFNGAIFSFDSVACDSTWEISASKIVIQNGQIISTLNLDTTGFDSSQQKQFLFRNVWWNNGAIDIILNGNGSEFFCVTTDTSTDAYALYVNTLEATNFNVQFDSWISTNGLIKFTVNSSCAIGLLQYFTKDIFSSVQLISGVGATVGNTLQTRGCYIGGSITLNGATAVWQPDAISYKQAIISNGATIDYSVMQGNLWPILGAQLTSTITPGPSGSAVISGTAVLDNYNGFTTNSGYAIPTGQDGPYEIDYSAVTAVSSAGNYNVNLFVTINGTTYARSVANDTATVSTTLGKTIARSITIPELVGGDFIRLVLQNAGDMDVDVTQASLNIRRVF